MNDDLARVQPGLREAVNAIMMMRSELIERETRMSASFNQQLHSLGQEVGQFRRDIEAIVGAAGNQIAKDAKAAVSPVAAEYDRAISATSAQLNGANRTVWMWFGAAGATLLLVLFVGWALLGYYRRELASAKEELQRYENALPIVQAFHASEATVCGGRVCVDVDKNGERHGDKKQYFPAKPRSMP